MMSDIFKEIDLTKRHIEVLKVVVEDDGPVGIVKLEDRTEYNIHEIRYSLRILEQKELIEPTTKGAVRTEKSKEFINNFNGQIDEIIHILQNTKIDN